MTLVDTNIFIDLLTHNPDWFDASQQALERRMSLGPILIVDAVFAELATGFTAEADCSDFLGALGVEHSTMSRQALWRAGRAFRDYRMRGGAKTNVLADFFIGAQAETIRVPLLTRDAVRYRTYFPEVELVAP
ncbi:type II toxin-antitoxin system VapC family toxin [Methylocystis sp. SC2]|uniref:type II toxin-antitoxin system VapC family toxin n=1 Tax=Methylocystis sp. (strain SC2) TaxID=187303 RepID=UPI00027AEFA5|nr:type II toxin-antitoxin system VapC family toxin [Methylocystis sp. SC2]CCJ08825.1 PilT protein domain protein [Methylocystis sp. SC2]